MIKKLYLLLFFLVCLSMLLLGCDNTLPKPTDPNGEGEATPTPQAMEDTEITVWTYEPDIPKTTASFEAANPGIKIKMEDFTYDNSNEAYLKALSEGTGPDVLIIDSSYMGDYVATDALQNLLEKPFSADQYKKDFPESLWDSNLSLDGQRLLALPVFTSPRVAFYRKDVMEQNGFPSDPDELAKYMEDPENWLKIGKKLKQNNQYIMQWARDITDLYGTTQGIFDRDLNYLRNSDHFKEGLDVCKAAYQAAMPSNLSVWQEAGQKAIRSGELAMIYIGTWGLEEVIEPIAPETKGNWRVTQLPFGLYGWSGSTVIAMNSQSEKKEAAWKYMEYVATHQAELENTDTIPGYLPARHRAVDMERSYAFLGGQKAYAVYSNLADKMKEYPITPLDNTALPIFQQGILDALENNADTDETLKSIEEKTNRELGSQKEILLDYLGK